MRPPYHPAYISLTKTIKTLLTRRPDVHGTRPRAARTSYRLVLLCALAGLVVTAFFNIPSSASFGHLPVETAGRSISVASGVKPNGVKGGVALSDAVGGGVAARTRGKASARINLLSLFASFFDDPVGEAIATYAADCATPKTTFNLGETVCAKVTNAPIGTPVQRRLTWAASSGAIVKSTNITAATQTDTFTLPSSPTILINGATVDNRGIWRVNSTDTSEGAVRALALFTVRNPSKPAVNLTLNQGVGLSDALVDAGSNIKSTLYVANEGPDNAQNVQLQVSIPANTSFVSAAQESGAAFNCAVPPSSGVLTCSMASLASGTQSVLSVVYQVNSNTPAETVIVNTASVASSTTELDASDNTASTKSVVRAAPANGVDECSYTCPGDITQPNDPGQAGAVVNYPSVGASDPSCTSTCSRLSGSFFPIGSTTVTCGDDTASCTFVVTVQDTRAIRVTLNGESQVEVECHDTFTDAGATAVDAAGQNVPVTVSGSVNTNTPGTYTITYTATDGTNTSTATRTVQVVDTSVPVITLNGADSMTVECHTSFTDPGATATDECAGNLTVTASGSVDVNKPGKYTITYTANDGTNVGTAERVVNVVDTAAPVPNLSTLPDVTGECSATISTTPTATDGCAGNINGTTTDPLTYDTQGTHTVTWTYTDASGNSSTQTQNVIIASAASAPVITLNGASVVTVECHTSFTDPGATASAACGGSADVQASGSVDANTPGTYTITYNATDTSGNAATPVTRTVNVVDTVPPTITLNGSASMTVECHTSFTDPGATAGDACAGNLSSAITTTGSVNPNSVGVYTLTYSVSDGSHTATATRTVNVVDTTAPTISCPANIVVTLPPHSTATSMAVSYPAVTASDSCASSVNVVSTPASGSVFPVGTTTVTSTATDAAGNSSSCSFTVTVRYDFTGFFQPVANLPTINVVNAGRAIPMKFSLSGNKGLNIFASGYPISGVVACDSTAPITDVEGTITSGGSSLSYDAASEQYNYNWKTEKAWEGTCRQFVMQLNDGSFYRANFKFK